MGFVSFPLDPKTNSRGYGETGKHRRLKIFRPQGLVGSIPTFPTNLSNMLERSQVARQRAVNSHIVGSTPTAPANI